MAEFFSMGGYAAYVWPAYGVAALVMVALLIATLRTLRKREALLRLLESERPRRRRRDGAPAPRPAVEGSKG